ncbi:MAG: hypothetical protein KatS3mg129_1440 [Leptospiraceae bacterium]|nr:MAG: hypothetical protein KatS3mg129_1440 [Leptospiraceae bacterium]
MKQKQKNPQQQREDALPKEQNIFYIQRIHKGISLRNISQLTGISRYTIEQIEKGNFDDLKIKDLLRLCEVLDIHVFHFFRTFYNITDNIFDDGLIDLVNELIRYRITIVLQELKTFCQYAQIRMDDFDLVEILSSPYTHEKLIILNKKLKENQITREEALNHFTPKYWKTSKRKH